jgi:hypothetical protein
MIGSLIACLLKLNQRVRVDAHQRQSRQTKRHECDVEHDDRLLAGAILSADPRKLSIANWAVERKDFISFGMGGEFSRRDFGQRAAIAGAGMARIVAVARNIIYTMCIMAATHSSVLTPGKMW